MKCKRCGKALGTDRGICPFCGAMLTQSQMEIYKQDKKERMLKPELLTEKYGENAPRALYGILFGGKTGGF